MSTSKPAVTLGRPVAQPARFSPDAVWIEGDYRYSYDSAQQICKRSPLNPQIQTGSVFLAATPAVIGKSRPKKARRKSQPAPIQGPQAAPLMPPPRRHRLVIATLWVVLVAAAIIFIYPLWPEAVYRYHQLYPGAAASGSYSLPASAANSSDASASAALADDQIPITDNRLIVPAIGVNTPIVEGSSLNILNQMEGVWHQTGNLTKGNFVLAGHRFRYLPPNTSTLYNLNKLQAGDLIAIDWLGKRIVYRITQVEVVPATDVTLLNPTSMPRLTLYSCNDIQQTQRVVVLAKPLPKP